ncbi:MAG: rhodanese-like domain-containing protein [Pseudomonadota bacterium]
MIQGLSANALQKMIKEEKENQYLIVDVRQSEEYRLDHIPGSVNIPLPEIQFDPYIFDDDRKVIFCCTRGPRSKVAAIFVSEVGYDENKLFYLKEGLFEYTGEILLEMPRVDLFYQDINSYAIMEKAIDFENGAFRFYTLAKEKLIGTNIYPIMEKMAKDEVAHGKSIYNRLRKIENVDMDFEAYFKTCNGQVLEGGKSFREIKEFLSKGSSNPCMDILDFAIELEYCAYDLYKIMAENFKSEHIKDIFFQLAQSEKKHLDQMINALKLCAQ